MSDRPPNKPATSFPPPDTEVVKTPEEANQVEIRFDSSEELNEFLRSERTLLEKAMKQRIIPEEGHFILRIYQMPSGPSDILVQIVERARATIEDHRERVTLLFRNKKSVTFEAVKVDGE